MLDKKGVYELLDRYRFTYEAYEHTPVYTIEEMDALNLPNKEKVVKNLFLRDDKKRNYYLVTLPCHKTVSLKNLSERIPSRKLSFASDTSLREFLMLEKGHVTPLGILNNAEHNVIVVFDKSLQNERIGIHPMENNATIFIGFEDVKRLIEDHGNAVVMCDFDSKQ
jgi:Ala-tRNA(Pro) deacylase